MKKLRCGSRALSLLTGFSPLLTACGNTTGAAKCVRAALGESSA